jgi:glutamine amidotransferase PdxT
MQYHVQADIKYLDGTLAGLVIPGGYSITVPDEHHAKRIVAKLARIQSENDFVRAACTGNKYQVVGNVSVAPVMPITFA